MRKLDRMAGAHILENAVRFEFVERIEIDTVQADAAAEGKCTGFCKLDERALPV